MTIEKQNEAWDNMPEEAKELVRNLYRTSHIPQYETVLGLVFGSHNLEKPTYKVGDLVIVMPGENSNMKFAGTIRAIHGDTAEVSIGSTLSILPLEKLFPVKRLAEDIAAEEKRIAEETNREADIMSNGMLCGVEEQGTEPQPQQGLIDHLFYRVKALEEDVERIKKKQ